MGTLRQVSLNLKRALIAAEDAFMEHEGFDWEAIQRA
jgi:membrane peptidoglycan carboxypeptidase